MEEYDEVDQGGTGEEEGYDDGNGPGWLDAIVPKYHEVTICHLVSHVEQVLDDISEIGPAAVVFGRVERSAVEAELLLMNMINRI